ncbi:MULTISPECIES: hypothetical protein [unclassified Bradyrhizobium]|uniref:hypothetical protein n=1 Tax=unclassified Bradyrhizobium TaxID=2631580 RepID=UPI0029170365|nr:MULTISPECIES: hypothetical protein [unclassified Bradyrhizobium]
MADPGSLAVVLHPDVVAAVVGAVLGAVGAGVLGIVGRRLDERRTSAALRRMLFAEIFSFVAVIESRGLADEIELLIKNPTELSPEWAKSGVSTENYFRIFEANTANLGSLDQSVVGPIAACYGLMKGSRDATRSLTAGWDTLRDDQKRRDLRAVARLVARSLRQADVAFERLKDEDQRLVRGMEDVLPQRSIKELIVRWNVIAVLDVGSRT